MLKIVGPRSRARSHLSTPPRRRGCQGFKREVKQLRRRRLRTHHLKSKFALFQKVVALILISGVQFVKCWQIFLGLNTKELCQSTGKEKEIRCLPAVHVLKKSEIRHFYVVMHVKSCCFANLNFYCLNLLLFAILVAVAVIVA